MTIARVFDGIDSGGEPFFSADHPRISDAAERERLVIYLKAGTPILWTSSLEADRVDPSRGGVVPRSFRTDGQWIWTDHVTYYLEKHGLRPDPDLYAHVVKNGYQCPTVDEIRAQRALDELYRSAQ